MNVEEKVGLSSLNLLSRLSVNFEVQIPWIAPHVVIGGTEIMNSLVMQRL